MPCRVFYDSSLDHTREHGTFTYRRATRPFIAINMCVRLSVETHSVVVVSCGDVHTESHSAGVDTVQAQGWSVVEREQPFAARNVRPLNLQ